MKRFWPHLLLCLFALSGCSESSDPTRKNDFIPLTSITITSSVTSIPNLTSTQFTAKGNFSDQFTRDVTEEVFWESSDTSILTISNAPGSQGRAKAVLPGTVTVSASAQGVTTEFDFTVTDATIVTLTIQPLDPSVPQGSTEQFSASGEFSDGTVQDLTQDVLWASSDTSVATISNDPGTEGLVTTLKASDTPITISATFDTETVSTELTVVAPVPESIEITPPDPSIETLEARQFRALANMSNKSILDITEEVTWASSREDLAVISSEGDRIGRAIGLAPGTTTITATYQDATPGGDDLTVTGDTDLTVNGEEVVGLSVNIGVPELPVDTSSQKTANITKADGSLVLNTDLVTWSSSDPQIATISNSALREGVVTGLSVGKTDIKATLGSFESEEEELTVNTAEPTSLTIAPENQSIVNLLNQQFTAEADFTDGTLNLPVTDTVTWSVDNGNIARISNEEPTFGLLTALNPGTVEVKARFEDLDLEDTTTLEVLDVELTEVIIDAIDPSVVVGETLKLSANGVFEDGETRDITDLVTWDSTESTIARINNDFGKKGLVEGLREGEVDVKIEIELGDEPDAKVLTDEIELTVNP